MTSASSPDPPREHHEWFKNLFNYKELCKPVNKEVIPKVTTPHAVVGPQLFYENCENFGSSQLNIKIARSEIHGRGVFITHPVRKGANIFAEVPAWRKFGCLDKIPDQATLKERRAFRSLHYVFPKDLKAKERFRDRFCKNKRQRLIFSQNTFEIQSENCLLFVGARLNHSSYPSAIIKPELMLTVVAIRDLTIGDEVTISYCCLQPPTNLLSNPRREFKCKCRGSDSCGLSSYGCLCHKCAIDSEQFTEKANDESSTSGTLASDEPLDVGLDRAHVIPDGDDHHAETLAAVHRHEIGMVIIMEAGEMLPVMSGARFDGPEDDCVLDTGAQCAQEPPARRSHESGRISQARAGALPLDFDALESNSAHNGVPAMAEADGRELNAVIPGHSGHIFQATPESSTDGGLAFPVNAQTAKKDRDAALEAEGHPSQIPAQDSETEASNSIIQSPTEWYLPSTSNPQLELAEHDGLEHISDRGISDTEPREPANGQIEEAEDAAEESGSDYNSYIIPLCERE